MQKAAPSENLTFSVDDAPTCFIGRIIADHSGQRVRNSERAVKLGLLRASGMDVAALFRRRLRKLILAKYRSLDRFYLETGFSKGHSTKASRS
jgi:hypothetical protein